MIYQRGRGFNKGGYKAICPTITSSSWQTNHSINGKQLTVKQVAILQGFDKDFILPKCVSNSQIYRLLGNTMSVNVLGKLIKEV